MMGFYCLLGFVVIFVLGLWGIVDGTECVKVIIAKVGAKGSQNKKIVGKDH